MRSFNQNKSIIRRLFITLLVISSFFIVETVVLFLSSQNQIKGLTQLNQVNQTSDKLDKIRELTSVLQDQMIVENMTFKENLRVVESAQKEISKLFLETDEAVNTSFPDLTEHIRTAKESMKEFAKNVKDFQKATAVHATQVLVTQQLAMETQEQLNKAQLQLNQKSHQIFSDIYDNRFRPLTISLILTVMLIATALYLGNTLSSKLARSLKNIFDATVAVSEGNFQTRAPILENDEIGKLTHSFNIMTEHLENSTVSRQYITSIIESMMDSVLVLDGEGKIVRANKNVHSTFGYDPDELMGQPLHIFFQTDYEIKKHKHEEETTALTKAGKTIPVSIGISPLESQGRWSGYSVCVISDITQLKEAEIQLKNKNVDLQNANRELEAFSYSVSHDLRSPLRSIDGFSQALIEDFGATLKPEAQDYLSRIRAAVQKMGKLIDDLLNLSRITRSAITPTHVSLSEIASEIANDLRSENPNRVVKFKIQDGIKAFADPSLMRVVLGNLLGNAWKYTSKHSEANIEFGVTNYKDKKNVYFVKDDGAGFDMVFLQKLFGAFQRLHTNSEFSGTGIGLATVQRIIHRHGGSIWAEAGVEKGATFYFTL